MRKNFCFFVCFLTLFSVHSVNAENIKAVELGSNHLDLKEIVLGEYQSSEIYEAPILAFTLTDSDINTDKISLSETSVKNKNISPQGLDKGLFSVFNLKGGVEKASGTMETETETEKTLVKQWLDGDYATGKWFGARPLFEERGVTINSSLLYSPMMKTAGGSSGTTNAKGYSLFNLSVTVDTEQAGMWKGGTFYALYQNKRGYGISGANGDDGGMGDWTGLDGWDWRQMSQISEYWYQQKFFDDKVRLKFGKQDANTDFGFLNSGWDFMNTAFSVNPTVPMPTYPDPAFGFMAEINPKEWLSIRNGIYSKFNTPFNMTEIEIKPNIKNLPGRYMIGAWEMADRSGFDVSAGIDSSGDTYYNTYNRNFGGYAGFEQMVYKEKKDDDNDMQGLVVFGQFGMSPSSKNDMSKYVGGGLHYVGPIPKRDKDVAGLAIASGNFAPRLGDITSQVGSETALECFYRVQITPWFYLQPDVQFIARPSGIYDNSVAIGLRSAITF